MKKNSIYALMSAIALSGGVMFSGCSSSDDVVTNEYGEEINPTYDPVAKTVKANFSIALTGQVNDAQQSGTRMQGADVQATGFLGIKNMVLIPYSSATAASGARNGSANIDLGTTGITTSAVNAKDASYYYHYLNVVVPTGTKSFLFYGVSTNGNAESVADRFKYGVLNPSFGDYNTANIKFGLVKICSTAYSENADRTTLTNYLNAIAGAKVSNDVKWSTTTDTYLQPLYQKFISQKSGSSFNIMATVQSIYSQIYNYDDPSGLVDAIITAMCGAENVYATEGYDNAEPPAKTGHLTFNAGLPDDYPASLNLPEGSALVKWTDGVAEYYGADDDYAAVNANKMTKYVFPASLYYFTNSPIHVSNKVQDGSYNAGTAWNDLVSGYGTGTSVTESTTDVVLDNKIQYAVGRLELTIKAGAAILKDHNEDDVELTSTKNFAVKGVLIGSQHSKTYDFSGNDGGELIIYDNAVNSGTKVTVDGGDPVVSTPANHTLALETADNTPITIAVEMVNNTDVAFVGADGIIPVGGTFYLLAQLDPTNKTPITQVFKQDYVTKVNLIINAEGGSNGLGNAYNTIPDLGTPAPRLGFSVDINWSNGIDFGDQTI